MHTRTLPAAIVLPAQAGTSPPVKGESRGDAPLARGLGDVPPITQKRPRAGGWGPTNVATQHPLPGEGAGLAPKDDHRMVRSHFNGPIPRRSLPPQGVGAGLALPCFPLSISGHLSPRPSASVRLAPWQIRLVPLCRRFRRPPAGPSDHRPASAWQIRLVSLCRLVRRASIPSCAASPQAGPAGKNAQHNSKQVNPPERGGVRATGVSGHAAVASLRGSPEGVSPLARGLGDVPPLPKTSEGGWVGPTNVAMPLCEANEPRSAS